jgi:hypothetical protein
MHIAIVEAYIIEKLQVADGLLADTWYKVEGQGAGLVSKGLRTLSG